MSYHMKSIVLCTILIMWSNFLTHDSYVSLPVDCDVEVIVSAVSSPALFYVQLSEHEERYVHTL